MQTLIKKTGMAVLISGKMDFRVKNNNRNREE